MSSEWSPNDLTMIQEKIHVVEFEKYLLSCWIGSTWNDGEIRDIWYMAIWGGTWWWAMESPQVLLTHYAVWWIGEHVPENQTQAV